MAGNQSRGLIQASKTKGWDPTVIPGSGPIGSFDLSTFDKDQGNLPEYPLGQFPEGPHVDAYPDGYSRGATTNTPADQLPIPKTEFATPDYSRENKVRHTPNADPFAGMGGTALAKGKGRP